MPPNNPNIGKGLVQLIRMGKYIRHKWIDTCTYVDVLSGVKSLNYDLSLYRHAFAHVICNKFQHHSV